MPRAASAYVDKEISKFMATPLPNTCLPPHFYVIGNELTNHQMTNQMTFICPVEERQSKAIALNASRVYTKFDGSGGTGPELSSKLLNDVKEHAKITGRAILGLQSKFTDDQYFCKGFVDSMN